MADKRMASFKAKQAPEQLAFSGRAPDIQSDSPLFCAVSSHASAASSRRDISGSTSRQIWQARGVHWPGLRSVLLPLSFAAAISSAKVISTPPLLCRHGGLCIDRRPSSGDVTIKRPNRNPQSASNFLNGNLRVAEQSLGHRDVLRRHGGWSAPDFPLGPGARQSGTGPFPDQVPFELSDGT